MLNFLRTLAVTLLLVACSSTPSPAPQRSWQVLARNVPGGALMSGVALPDGSALLVGGQATLGAVWQWQNAALTAVAVPAGKLLSWASRLPDGSALVVGNGRRALWRAADGTWTVEALPDGDELWGCLAFSHDDAWAVGGDPLADGTSATPVLLHRTAAGWSPVALPKLQQPQVRLFKVAGQNPSDVVVVGDEGEALHFDGTTWTEEPSGTGANLTTVRALADGRYVAVGGSTTGIIQLRETTGVWHTLRTVESGLSGVDAWDDRFWVCGAAGWLESVARDGSSAQAADMLTTDDLHLMLRLPNGDALAGGGNFGAFNATMHGVLLGWSL